MFSIIYDFSNVHFLRKYTTIPVLMDILDRKRISLLDPKKWEDRNDWKIMDKYRELKNKKSILATCFSYGNESIYHWNAFSKENDGCMISFYAPALIKHVRSNYPDVRMGKIQYKNIRDLKNGVVRDEIPFTKRSPYSCEKEFRMLQLFDDEIKSFDVSFDISHICKIVLTQKLSDCIVETMKAKLADLGVPRDKIFKSTILENKQWVHFFEEMKV